MKQQHVDGWWTVKSCVCVIIALQACRYISHCMAKVVIPVRWCVDTELRWFSASKPKWTNVEQRYTPNVVDDNGVCIAHRMDRRPSHGDRSNQTLPNFSIPWHIALSITHFCIGTNNKSKACCMNLHMERSINTGAGWMRAHMNTKVTDNFLNNCECVMPRTREKESQSINDMRHRMEWKLQKYSPPSSRPSLAPSPSSSITTRSTNETLLIHVVNCLSDCIATKFCAPVFLSCKRA